MTLHRRPFAGRPAYPSPSLFGAHDLPFGRGDATSAAGWSWSYGIADEDTLVQEEDPYELASWFFPALADWRPVLSNLHLTTSDAVRLASLAHRNGTDFETELLTSGLVAESELFSVLAKVLGVPFIAAVEPDCLIVREADAMALLKGEGDSRIVKVEENGSDVTGFLIAPQRTGPNALEKTFDRYRGVRGRVRITPPAVLRSALTVRARPALVHQAVAGLFEQMPIMSARIVANAWQGTVFGAAAVGLPVALVLQPAATYTGLHYFFSLFFMACVGLRLAALPSALPVARQKVAPFLAKDMPSYTVLVALYNEADIAHDLVRSLRRIVWPPSKLEVKLVCEADDLDTIAALHSVRLPPNFEILAVPPAGPRTKPKALAYALPMSKGEYVALYDAEDHPDPFQLVQAWQRFREAGPELACVQAPLEIVNGGDTIIARLFAFEYAALFRGLLPWLSRNGLPLPLGGTSNHFRRSVLEEVGGWDPYNVTEDADLGLRLARFGYRTETISRPTFETAPADFGTWLPQRTRWFKGWIQTWLVHMRNPIRLMRELGPASFLITQILFAGMVVSALAHPILVFTAILLVLDLAFTGVLGTWQSTLLIVDVINIACGYLSFLLLGRQTLAKGERTSFWKIVLFTPVYWIMMSIAAWRATIHLWRSPHLWEKTPHFRIKATTPVPPPTMRMPGEAGLTSP